MKIFMCIIALAVISLWILPVDDWLREGDTQGVALEAFEEVNQIRSESGLSLLAWDKELATQALKHSQYMSDNGELQHSGFPGENILRGRGAFGSGHSVIDVWLESPPHKQNLMRFDIHSGAIGIKGNYATFMAW